MKKKLKVALYSHDTMGLGHMRRNILVAQAFASSELRTAMLLIAGSLEAARFSMPEGVDCLTLPALRKEIEGGQYHSRRLDVSLENLTDIRTRTICAALEAFEPDVLIVDKEPLGANGELKLVLDQLREHGHTSFVLGLRDVLDEPGFVNEEIRCKSCSAKENDIRHYYDAIWVYGDPTVYDLVRECGFSSDIAANVRYTGYMDQNAWLEPSNGNKSKIQSDFNSSNPPIVCMVGGGQDGANLTLAFAEATLPPETNGIIVTGPFMPMEVQCRLQHITSTRRNLQVVEFSPDSALLTNCASKVISMGGYNTICEILSFKKEALIIPRMRPRMEQYVRAKSLNNLGLVDMLHPDDLTPEALTCWMKTPSKANSIAHRKIDMNGLDRLPGMLEELLNKTYYTKQKKPQTVGGASCQ
jgi:predicted glycosyltransferase